MNRKFTTLVGGSAIAGLVLAGAVAATANGGQTIEKVGYFEVQSKTNNIAPTAWFSEGDDDVAGLSIGADGIALAPSAKSGGINKIVNVPFDASKSFAIDAEGTARYSIVLTSDDVDYLRITALDSALTADTLWAATGYWKDDARTPASPGVQIAQTLAQWAADEDPWGAGDVLDGALLHQIGARHFSGEGAGSVASITYDATTYAFGTTAFDQADIDAAKAEVPAGYVSQAAADAAVASAVAPLNAKIGTLEAKVADLEAQLAAAKKATASAEKAAAKANDAALKAQAAAPYEVSGTVKVGKTLRVKGKSYSGISVKYQWYVGGKKVSKATKSTYKLAKADRNKSVRVDVTLSYRTSSGKKVTVVQKVSPTTNVKVAR